MTAHLRVTSVAQSPLHGVVTVPCSTTVVPAGNDASQIFGQSMPGGVLVMCWSPVSVNVTFRRCGSAAGVAWPNAAVAAASSCLTGSVHAPGPKFQHAAAH